MGRRPRAAVKGPARMPPFGRWAQQALANGFDVTLHLWHYRQVRELTLKVYLADAANRTLCSRGVTVRNGGPWSDTVVRWSDVFMLTTEEQEVVDPANIYQMPGSLAKEWAAAEPTDRDSARVIDCVRRALAARAWAFNGVFRSPMSWECPRRLAQTEQISREIDAAYANDGPIRPDGSGYMGQRATEKPTDEETAALFAWEREHLGVDRIAGTVSRGVP